MCNWWEDPDPVAQSSVDETLPTGTTAVTCERPTIRITGPDGTSPPCTVCPVDGTIELRGVPSSGSGSYQWTPSSTRITLQNDTSETVTVRGGNSPSSSRDAETVNLAYTPSDSPSPLNASVNLTVVRVRFTEASRQTNGFDDLDSPSGAPHLSVKKNGSTLVHVAIEGGINASDLAWACEATDTAQVVAPPAETGFDLRVNGQLQDKAETRLHARCTCAQHTTCGCLYVNVYRELRANATVAKVWDSRSSGTRLRFPNMNLADVANLVTPKYKHAVALMNLVDHDSGGGAVDIPFDDHERDGKLTYEIGVGGPEMDAINDRFNVPGQRVVIVRDMLSIYYLGERAREHDTTITLKSQYSGGVYLVPGGTYWLGTGGNREEITVAPNGAQQSSNIVTLSSGLRHDHGRSDAVEFPAGGWGGNPIIIIEGSVSEEVLKWTYGHEVGHALLSLQDVEAPTSLMHWQQSWTDHRLRYKSLPLKYVTGAESQWETVDR